MKKLTAKDKTCFTCYYKFHYPSDGVFVMRCGNSKSERNGKVIYPKNKCNKWEEDYEIIDS